MKGNFTITTFNRRKFLSTIAITAAAGLISQCGIVTNDTHFSLHHSRQMMGTLVNFTLLGPDQQSCQEALTKTIRRMENLAGILSRHDPNSDLSKLNSQGTLHNPPPALYEVISLSEKISNQTSGAFDITVLPLIQLYQKGKKAGTLPDQKHIASTLGLVDYRQISHTPKIISLKQKGMAITLDGIGKGYIVDEGVKTLHNLGFNNIYLEAGGDLKVSGKKANDRPWRIGIRTPRPQNSEKLTTIDLHNMAIATSGDYLQYYSNDKKNHHIINPHTGFSPPELASSTITAPTVAQADGLATATMVLGPSKSLELLEAIPNCSGHLIDKDLVTYTTNGFFG